MSNERWPVNKPEHWNLIITLKNWHASWLFWSIPNVFLKEKILAQCTRYCTLGTPPTRQEEYDLSKLVFLHPTQSCNTVWPTFAPSGSLTAISCHLVTQHISTFSSYVSEFQHNTHTISDMFDLKKYTSKIIMSWSHGAQHGASRNSEPNSMCCDHTSLL